MDQSLRTAIATPAGAEVAVEPRAARRWTIGLLLSGTAIVKAATFMSMPFLSLFLVRSSTLSPALIGVIVGAGPLANLAGGFWGGQASDRIGRHGLLHASLFGSGAVSVGFYAASLIPPSPLQYALFGLLNVLLGVLSSFFTPVSQALMADVLPPEQRASVFQMRYAALNVGAAVGPALGAVTGMAASAGAFLLTGAVYLVYGVLLLASLARLGAPACAPRPTRGVTLKEATGVLASDRRLLWFLLSGIVFNVCYAQIESTLSQHLVARFADGVRLFSIVLSLNAAVVLLLQVPLFFSTRRARPTRALLAGTAIFAAGMALLAGAGGSARLVMVAIAVASAGEILVFPVGSQLIDVLAPADLRGAYFGASSLRQIGLSIGPVLGGAVLSAGGGAVLFSAVSALAMSSCVFHVLGERAQPLHPPCEE